MVSWLNYHHLFYFYTIAKEGGVAKAAKRLRLGQSTLSTQLKQFEDVLGHQLFERSKNQLKLTEEGKIALDYATEIFRLGGEFIATLEDQKNTSQVHLQIGALDFLAKTLIHRAVESAQRDDDCFVTLLEGPFDYLLRELVAHKLDLALTDGPIMGDAFRSRKVAEFPLVLCAAKEFAKLKKGFPQSLNGQNFVLPTAHSRLRQELEHYFELQKIRVLAIGETQDLELQKFFVQSGKALAALPQPVAHALGKEGRVIQLGILDGLKEELWITSAKRKIENRVARRLMQEFEV